MEAALFAFVVGVVVGAIGMVMLMSSAIRGQELRSQFPAATHYERKRVAELNKRSAALVADPTWWWNVLLQGPRPNESREEFVRRLDAVIEATPLDKELKAASRQFSPWRG